MPLPRLHLFELEDQPWFSAVVRDFATDYLHFIESRFSLHRPVVPLLAEALRITNSDHVVDLCSGGAGPIPALARDLAAEGTPARFTLTDRFPNLDAFVRMAGVSAGTIIFSAEPVDARDVPRELTGFRTLFNAFHHFNPADAVAVLRNAAEAGQPIGIFEIPDRRLGTLLPLFFLTPLMVWLTTPFIRPFRWRRLLWTYLIPLVPLTCWWDGIVSQLRAYTAAELEALAAEVGVDSFTWRAGRIPIGSAPGWLTYLIGYQTPPLEADTGEPHG